MRARLPAESARLFDAVIADAERRRETLWLVGGAVRDCLADQALADLDVAVDGSPAGLAAAVCRAVGGTMERAPQFGTASVTLDGRRLDLAWLRGERYEHPGALPTVEPGATIEEDLRRRDFTVNALALGLTGPRRGELVDPTGGAADLAARRLRVLHDRSFIDDATRLWRGARYAARLRLRPERHTATLIAEGAIWLRRVSKHRLWAECCRCTHERRVGESFRLLDRWGVLAGTAPGLALAPAADRALTRHAGPLDPALALAVLLAPLAAREREAAIDRLAPPRESRRAVAEASALLALVGDAPEDLAVVEGAGPEARTAALWLDPARQRSVQRVLRRWERTRPSLDAEALLALGVPRGPALGEALRRLRRERYLGTLSGAAQARAFARRELAPGGANT